MKSWVITESFGLENLKLTERPKPLPGPGEALVKMSAVSLNYRDLLTVRGRYNPKQPLPLIPCSDGVGEVVAVGEGVSSLAVGARVATLFSQSWMDGGLRAEHRGATLGGPLDGALTELGVFRAEGLIPVPEHLSDAEAACLPCAGLTAWSALVTEGGVKAGDTVLVIGTGGVALFALQFARMLGARVIVTSRSKAKLARALELGAWRGIDSSETPKWGKAARDLTGGAGVDHVVELGGSKTLPQSMAALRPGGTMSLIGVLSGTVSDLDIIPIIMGGLRVQGILVGSRAGFEAMSRAVAQHEMRPVVDEVFDFAEAPRAFEAMAAAGHFGKLAIRVQGG